MNTIDIRALSELEQPTLIDVREVVEYVSGHAPEAVNIPLSEFVARASEIPEGGDVYIICESGGRSAQAAEWLTAQGVVRHQRAGRNLGLARGRAAPRDGGQLTMWNPFRKNYARISVAEAKALVRSGAVLIDVRNRDEWNSGHAREARHIPLDTLESKLGSLSKGRPVVAICQSGMRSALAARMLATQGFEASTVRGGMMAWNRAGG